MKITALSRSQFLGITEFLKTLESEGTTLDANVYIISIHSDSPVITPELTETFKKVGVKGWVSLDFDDITPKDLHEEYRNTSMVRANGDFVCFNEDHAKQIVEFMKTIKNNENSESLKNTHVIIHCYAGISRSGAVACSFLDSFYFKNHINANEFIRENTQICPNYHVKNLIMKQMYEKQT